MQLDTAGIEGGGVVNLQFLAPKIEDADIDARVGGGEAVGKLFQQLVVPIKVLPNC